MGFWNDGIRARSRSKSRSRSRSRSNSPARTHRPSNAGSHSSKHYAARPSAARSVSSFFSAGGASSTSRGRSRSYTSASPRAGFVHRVRKFLRQVYEYMRKHPVKVFMLVIMPLITGGALAKLLATVGIRLPRNLEQMMGARGNEQRFFARGGARDFGTGAALPGMAPETSNAINTAINLAKLFI